MSKTVEALKAEVKQLQVTLAAKEAELQKTIQSSKMEREASRNTAAEDRLAQSLKRVLVNLDRIDVCVYPDTTIVTLPLMHSAFHEIRGLFFSFLNQNLLKIEKVRPPFGDIQTIQVSFPSVNLPDFEEGMRLSEGVDLARDRCRIQADC